MANALRKQINRHSRWNIPSSKHNSLLGAMKEYIMTNCEMKLCMMDGYNIWYGMVTYESLIVIYNINIYLFRTMLMNNYW